MSNDKAKPIEWHSVTHSSNVLAAAYDKAQSALFVRFAGGRTYAYYGATESDLSELVNSASPGRYVHRHLSRFPAAQV